MHDPPTRSGRRHDGAFFFWRGGWGRILRLELLWFPLWRVLPARAVFGLDAHELCDLVLELAPFVPQLPDLREENAHLPGEGLAEIVQVFRGSTVVVF